MEYIRSFISLFDLTVERFAICLLCVTAIMLYKRLRIIEHKYAQLDKLVFGHALIISNQMGIKTIKIHRSSDYEVAQPINQINVPSPANPLDTQP